MKGLRGALIFLLVVCGADAAAQAPALATIPPAVAANHPGLVQQRAGLETDRAAIRSRAEAHSAQCGAVKEGSPQHTACAQSRSELETTIMDHVARSNAFNSAVKSAAAATAPPVASGGARVGGTMLANFQGTVTVTDADGRAIPASSAAQIPLEQGTQVRTGPNSRATLTFSDQTRVVVGPNSTFTLKEVAPPGGRSIAVELKAGMVRWATGKLMQPSVHTATVVTSTRGTDFECAVAENGEETVKVYSGEVDVTHAASGRVVLVGAGNMLSITSAGVSTPTPIR